MSVVSVVEEMYSVENHVIDSVVITTVQQGPPGPPGQGFLIGNDGTLSITSTNNKIIMGVAKTPSSPTASGQAGEICWDSDYFYVCTETDTWNRFAKDVSWI